MSCNQYLLVTKVNEYLSAIEHVSDTALWVATYRAKETLREDSLFKDPYAELLAGERGRAIANEMPSSRYAEWSVILRTHIIDRFIWELVEDGVDTIVNLGAGLDTRPYRMDLPKDLKWIEVDYGGILEMKQEQLKNHKPNCQLELYQLDLLDQIQRKNFFSNLPGKKTLALTEGVLPYLPNEEVSKLALDLRESHFRYWIADYFSSAVLKYLKRTDLRQKLAKAPFQFYPKDWFVFFEEQGWKVREMRYLIEESIRLKRAVPLPWWAKFLVSLSPKKSKDELKKYLGYAILEP